MTVSRRMDQEVFIVVGVGLMLLAGGAALIAVMFDWLPDPEFLEIKPGEGLAVDRIQGRALGRLDVSYDTKDGRPVQSIILDEEEYRLYASGRSHDSMFENEGASGDFSGHVHYERYCLIFERLPGNVTSLSEPVEIVCTISVTGINPAFAVASVALGAAGLGLLAKGILDPNF